MALRKKNKRVCCLEHTLPNVACNAVGVAFGVEEANRADSMFKRAEMLPPVTNPRFCDCDRMHATCMQIFENAINCLRGLAEQTPNEVSEVGYGLSSLRRRMNRIDSAIVDCASTPVCLYCWTLYREPTEVNDRHSGYCLHLATASCLYLA